ncbi:MAG TPA: hypothetical protein VMA30_08295 [Xanthobacteraceae bacterium]|nr:hypothetical protein [Xanthobacteraceae bacterium]
MSIKIDLANQVRQTTIPAWRPLLPLFEAIMNSFQAIKDANLPAHTIGKISIDVYRQPDLLGENAPPIVGFRISDNGIGLDDDNFDSFNTAYSPHKLKKGGKGLGRFTWLKAFDCAKIESTFLTEEGYLTRSFVFDEQYDLDDRGLPHANGASKSGTMIDLVGLRSEFVGKCPRDPDRFVQKVIEHFILVLLEPDCPNVTIHDLGKVYDINSIFVRDYQGTASTHTFKINEHLFTMYGFRLPTSRTTKHTLLYAADQRAVLSEKLEAYLPNLRSRLEDEDGEAFFYLAIIQSSYLSAHVSANRADFDFDSSEDAEMELDFGDELIPRSDIRDRAVAFIEGDLAGIIESINAAKLQRVRAYIRSHAPQYRILLKYANEFLNLLPPHPTRNQIEAALHTELHKREVELRRESTRIIKEADKIDNYDEYHRRLNQFIDQYNELGVSALVQYVAHRKIILEFLQKAVEIPEGSSKYPLEEVVHRLVFPMHSTSDDIPYHEQNLWMIDERLTYHSLIASDKQLRSLELLRTNSAQRGDIVIFDEKIIFSDVDPSEHPINSITTIEFKRPGRDDYTSAENPLEQAFKLIDEIRNSEFEIRGRSVSVSNRDIPATAYCICDMTPTMRQVLKTFDAFTTPDKQGYYGFHRGYNTYYEVVDYSKMLQDAKKRNRIFFDKLNIPPTS